MDSIKTSGRWFAGLGLLLAIGVLAGCDTLSNDRSGTKSGTETVASANPLAVGDKILVSYQDIQTAVPATDTQVKEDGTVTLIYNQTFKAAGKTVGDLEKDIRAVYVPKYFVNMTPTVKIQDRFYTVGGEVRNPGRQLYTGKVTVLTAIESAGGFTDFGNHGNVLVTRLNGKKETENTRKALTNPARDLEIFPGDLVTVRKRFW